MAKRKQEEATCSFHYLVREKRVEGKDPEIVPFTDEQFKEFCDILLAQPKIDLSDDETCKRLKTTNLAPVEMCEKVDDRTVFGRFRSLYSGHAYDNTDVGEIPDSSVSLRPFFFLAYLSESGRIYVGSQYLGQFGGYMGLFQTLRLLLPEPVVSISFRHDATSYKDAKPKEVRVNFSRKPNEITGSNKFGQRGAMTFKSNSNSDIEFNDTVTTKLLAKIGQPNAVIKKAVADMLSGNEILALRDEDIEDCTVIATVNGKKQTINIIEAGHFATRFPLEIAEYIKGHPDRVKSKAAMMKLLKDQIISRTEHV
ncbi:hypothetical protein PQU92_12265 [Asticcacaulis sp. BYS171W]|uniref:Uncharacterized protein n=1 Tax=Asticcacaulis aquaticus TaxID=2984212 RepID=A0ABT5HVF5_9CAUL|nr:hypothetical protein [Asticcacaulis aquaticus]MDC7684055.1 hypothetical protein [Asticcacaulis aquaticus]